MLDPGVRYWEGDGLPRDLDSSRKWLTKAAEANNDQAMLVLATQAMRASLASPERAPDLVAEGLSWYERAAERGNTFAQNQLALAYHDGVGVPEDLVTAATWASLAKQGPALTAFDAAGRETFEGKLDRIDARLTPKQKQQVEHRVAEWIQAHPRVIRLHSRVLPDGTILMEVVGGKNVKP